MYVYKYIYMQICIHAKTIYLVYTHIYCLGFILYATAPLSLSLFGVLFVSFSFFLSFPDACIHAQISDPKHV